MDSRGSREIVKTNKFYATGESQLHVLAEAGHQLFMNNPEGFIELVVADLTGVIKNQFETRSYTMMYVDNFGQPMKGFYDDAEERSHM